MSTLYDPNFTPTAEIAILVTASVLTSASAKAAGLGPFRGLYINTSTSFTVAHSNDTSVSYNDFGKGSYLWVAGEFLSAISTATAIYALK